MERICFALYGIRANEHSYAGTLPPAARQSHATSDRCREAGTATSAHYAREAQEGSVLSLVDPAAAGLRTEAVQKETDSDPPRDG